MATRLDSAVKRLLGGLRGMSPWRLAEVLRGDDGACPETEGRRRGDSEGVDPPDAPGPTSQIQRVKDISHDDAVAEGCYRIEPCEAYPNGNAWGRAGFSALWDSINKDRGYGWEANPWVWVVEFRCINTESDKS